MILAMNKDGELEEYKEPVRYDNSDTLLPMCAECRYQASYESEE